MNAADVVISRAGALSVAETAVCGKAAVFVPYPEATGNHQYFNAKAVADAGGAELCGNPLALASALRKISGDPGLENVKRDDIAQLFIIHPQHFAPGLTSFFSSLFSTHPDTQKRIEILEQF